MPFARHESAFHGNGQHGIVRLRCELLIAQQSSLHIFRSVQPLPAETATQVQSNLQQGQNPKADAVCMLALTHQPPHVSSTRPSPQHINGTARHFKMGSGGPALHDISAVVSTIIIDEHAIRFRRHICSLQASSFF